MICQPCQQAADQQLGRDAHCDDPKCMCGHRVDRYRTSDGYAAFANFYNQLNRVTAQARAREEQYRRALPARAAKIADHLTTLLPDEAREAGIHFAFDTTTDQCRAEFHHPTMQSARCDLPTGHGELHREQPKPDRSAFRWDESVAMYPTDTTTED